MADITELLKTGDSAKRVDIVIVAEGYTQAERAKFLADAATFLNTFLGADNARLNAPFSTYSSFFNATALFFASAQSGTDQPNNGISVNTYFNSTQHGSDGRLLYGDTGRVELAVSQALASNAHELTIVLVNTPLYGGAGGSVAWASAGNSSASELALHEIGHSFADLQDEYVDANVAKDFPLTAPNFLNSPHVTDSLSRIPWSDWLGYKDGELGTIGTYQGGYYRATGIWRATQNSKMLSLGTPFSAPEKEAFALKYYQAIGDYLSVSSVLPGLYQAVTPNNDVFSFAWKYQGTSLTSSKSGQFDAFANNAYSMGSGLSVTTLDRTGTIRKDLNLTQQIETINVSTPVKQIGDVSYVINAADFNQVVQFSAANNFIEIKDVTGSQRIYIDGGAGTDTIKISANLVSATQFSLNQLSSGTTLIATQALTNWGVRGVENIQFQDFTVNLAIHANASSITKAALSAIEDLYVAYFNRIPEADGLNYWITQYKGGMSLNGIADSFYSAAIAFSSLTGYSDKMTPEAFINIIYQNALGRKEGADTAGLDYWTTQLKTGKDTPGTLVNTILNSAHDYKGDKTWGWVADLLDNKIAVANKFAVEWGLGYSSPEASIVNGMAIAKQITATDMTIALSLIGITEGQIIFI
jgi:hypothetical protein